MSQCPAISAPQRLNGLTIAAEDELAHTEAHRGRGSPVFAGFQLRHGIAENAKLLIVLGNRPHELANLTGAERVIRENNVADVDWYRHGSNSDAKSLNGRLAACCAAKHGCFYHREAPRRPRPAFRSEKGPAVGVEPTTPALRMRCSAD